MKYSICEKYKFKLASIEVMTVDLPDIDSEHPISRYIRLKDGMLSIYKGYCWDGSSVPFKNFVGFVSSGKIDFDKYCKIASLHHDSLCQLIRLGLLDKKHKQYIDTLYKDECILGGMNKKAASIRLWFLRKFGNKGVKKREHPKGEIFEVLNHG